MNPDVPLKDVHHRIYDIYKQLYPVQDYEQEVLNVEKDEQRLRFYAIATSKYYPCEYCRQKDCDGCFIPYDDTPIRVFTEKVEEGKI